MSSTASFASETYYHAVSDSEESAGSYSDDNIFRKGDAIEVISGKYKGRSGVVRKTPVKWIPLLLHPTSTESSKEVCLPPTSVRKVRRNAGMNYEANVDENVSPPNQPSSRTSAAPSEPQPAPPSHDSHTSSQERNEPATDFQGETYYNAISDSEGSTVYETDDDDNDETAIRQGVTIEVVAGKYKGRTGVVTKIPVKWIPVLLHSTSTESSKEACLPPASVRKVRNATRSNYDEDGDETMSPPPPPRTSTVPPVATASYRIENSLLSLPGYQHDRCLMVPDGKETTFGPTLASKLFHLVNYSFPINKNSPAIPTEWTESGHTLQLIATKVHDHKIGKEKRTTYTLMAHYGIAKDGLLQTLEDYAAFGMLPPRKVASRLELLFTPAIKNHRQIPAICHDITTDYLEMLPDDDSIHSDGCGFVPRWVIEKLFGQLTDGKRTFAFMVRILAPQIGLVKGVLMEKPGIDKIQLHPTMIKVPPSQRNPNSKKVILLASRSYPSKNNLQEARLLKKDKEPCKSFKPNKLKHMATNVLEASQIPKTVIDKYVKNATSTNGLEHAFVLGASDPTNAIPPGHVFLSGFTHDLPDHILVTRFPCTESSDLLKLPLVKTKPHGMSDEQWQFLTKLAFGAILFGNPGNGRGPLPPMIANGDLDGDLYMVLWNKGLGSYVPVTDTTLFCPAAKTETKLNDEWNPNWLTDAYGLMSDINALYLRQTLIGKLHTLWKKSDDHAKCHAFGRAYKEAIDIGKHGGKVPLPRAFWSDLKLEYHVLLEDARYS